jgi:hypothetical protein
VSWYEQMAKELSSALSNRDFRAIERWVHTEVVFDFSRSMNDIRGVYDGVDAMEEGLLHFFEPWQEVRWELDGLEPLDHRRILARTRIHAMGQGSGIEIEAQGAQIWEHSDEKLVRVTMFQGPDDARAFIAGESAEAPEA